MYSQAVNWLKSFVEKNDGVTAIEYGLITALIAVLIIANITIVGTELTTTLDAVSRALQTANGS